MPHPDNTGWMSLLLGVPLDGDLVASSPDELPAIRAGIDLSVNNVDLPAVGALHTDVVLWEGSGRRLTAEIVVPQGTGPFPALVYFHGGAFCVGSAMGVRRPCMRFAAGAGYVVINVDYALAPEHPFPAGVEDALYACRWAVTEGLRFGVDPSCVVVGGDSAGANLASVCTHLLHGDPGLVDGRDLSGVDLRIAGALLLFGLFDMPMSVLEPGSNQGSIEVWLHQAYLGPHWLRHHRSPLVSPLRAPNLSQFPPCYLTVGCEDSLASQTLEMARRLCAADVPTTVSVVAGLDHAFHYVEHKLPTRVTPEMERMIQWLRWIAAPVQVTAALTNVR